MNRSYLTLISRIEKELSELDKILKKINRGWKKVEDTEDELYIDSVALNLHDYYACLERIFKLIASEIDESLPRGESWHEELLKQMETEIKNTRPPALKTETTNQLDEYRGFRHVVRNVYTFNLSRERIKPLVQNLPKLNQKLREDVESFLSFLEEQAEID